jgi:predicted molibdopterin-dependent oxidoreductase YjgC
MDEKQEIVFEFDGQNIKAAQGQTIAEALLSQGVIVLRKTRNNEPRGVFCGMGLCHECRMIVDGAANIRACITPVRPGVSVKTQNDFELDKI